MNVIKLQSAGSAEGGSRSFRWKSTFITFSQDKDSILFYYDNYLHVPLRWNYPAAK